MSKNPNVRIIETEDGSHSLYNDQLKETYHSSRGAIQESEHVFINAGLEVCRANPIHILEIGFGTGLNVLLSVLWSVRTNTPVAITSLEAFPLADSITESLNYGTLLNAEEWFRKVHAQPWNEKVSYEHGITLEKLNVDWKEFPLDHTFDVIFYDAFAPSRQPEMWELSLIQKACDALKPDGIFVTYSARGQLKRDLASAGMVVETLPGPPGKKEMVRAVKK